MATKDVPAGVLRHRHVKQEEEKANIAESIQGLVKHVHPPVPNPAPLGLIGFGLTTCLLQMKHTRLTGDSVVEMNGVDTVVLGFAMFFGGLLQIIAGISEIKRNNIFGYTAFCLYGGFWMSVGTVEIVTLLATNAPVPTNPLAAQAMLFMVGVFTFMLWVLTFKLNKTVCSLFFLLGVTCILLSFGVQNPTVDMVGGWFGIATSANAFWLAFAELVNDVYGEGKEVIPLGQWHLNKFKRAGGTHVPGHIHGHRTPVIVQEMGPSATDHVAAPAAEVACDATHEEDHHSDEADLNV